MLYAVLILLFLLVFAFLAWRIISSATLTTPKPESYVCPHCNESHCDCYKGSDAQ